MSIFDGEHFSLWSNSKKQKFKQQLLQELYSLLCWAIIFLNLLQIQINSQTRVYLLWVARYPIRVTYVYVLKVMNFRHSNQNIPANF